LTEIAAWAEAEGLADRKAGVVGDLKRRATGARCVESQALAPQRRAYPAGGRAPRALPGSGRPDRRAAPFRSGAGTTLHLVGLPLSAVLREGLRLAPGPCPGHATAQQAPAIARYRAGNADLAAAVR